MKATKPCIIKYLSLFIFLVFLLIPLNAQSAAVDQMKWAWAENAGWLNVDSNATYGPENKTTKLEGSVWHENIGWVKLNHGNDPSVSYANTAIDNWGVNRNPVTSELYGYAWSESVGWIYFGSNNSNNTFSRVKYDDNATKGKKLNGWAWSENIGYIKFNPHEVPKSPINFQISQPSALEVKLEWKDNSVIEDGFKIYRSANSNPTSYELIHEVTTGIDQNGTGKLFSWIDTDIEPYSCSFYAVTAYNAIGDSDSAPALSLRLSKGTLTKPQLFDAAADSNSTIKLTWTDNNSNETGFKIFRGGQLIHTITTQACGGITEATSYSWVDSGLSTGTGYTYKVETYNTDNSAESDEDTASIHINGAPAMPVDINGTVSEGKVTLHWKDNSNNETGFKILRGMGTNPISYELIHTLTGLDVNGTRVHETGTGNTLYWQDPVDTKYGDYIYQIKAFNNAGESAPATKLLNMNTTVVITPGGEAFDLNYPGKTKNDKYVTVNSGSSLQFLPTNTCGDGVIWKAKRNTTLGWIDDNLLITDYGKFTPPITGNFAGVYRITAIESLNNAPVKDREKTIEIVVPIKIDPKGRSWVLDGNPQTTEAFEGTGYDKNKMGWQTIILDGNATVNAGTLAANSPVDGNATFTPFTNLSGNDITLGFKIEIFDTTGWLDSRAYGRTIPMYLKKGETLSGTVKNQTGTAIQGATVRVIGTGYKVNTDATGNFSSLLIPTVNDINIGKEYTIKAEKTGYSTQTISWAVGTSLDFTLQSISTLSGFVKSGGTGILGARVALFCNDGTKTGPITTAADGSYTFSYPASVTGGTVWAWKEGYKANSDPSFTGADIALQQARSLILDATDDFKEFKLAVSSVAEFNNSADECTVILDTNGYNISNNGNLNTGNWNSVSKSHDYIYTYDTKNRDEIIGFRIDSVSPQTEQWFYPLNVSGTGDKIRSVEIDKHVGGEITVTVDNFTGKCEFPPGFIQTPDQERINAVITKTKYGVDLKVVDMEGRNVAINNALITLPYPENIDWLKEYMIGYQQTVNSEWKDGLKDGTASIISAEISNTGERILTFSVKHFTGFGIFHEPPTVDPEEPADPNPPIIIPGDKTAVPSGNSGGGCFIATAAYGSKYDPSVDILSRFRDAYLLTNQAGRAFVDGYYKYSPAIANFIGQHDTLRFAVRIGLAPLVGISYIALNTTGIQKIIIFSFIITFFAVLIVKRKRIFLTAS